MRKQSEQSGASERISGASEQASEWPSTYVSTYVSILVSSRPQCCDPTKSHNIPPVSVVVVGVHGGQMGGQHLFDVTGESGGGGHGGDGGNRRRRGDGFFRRRRDQFCAEMKRREWIRKSRAKSSESNQTGFTCSCNYITIQICVEQATGFNQNWFFFINIRMYLLPLYRTRP